MFNFDKEKLDKKTKVCNGNRFRCRINCYVNKKGGFVYQEKMIPLKKMSCEGCESCIGTFTEDLQEFIEMDKIPEIEDMEDGAIYKLAITNESRDWETGMIDDWDLSFIKVKEETLRR